MATQKPFVAYDKDGKEHRYLTMLDARQACELAGYSLTPPNQGTPATVLPRQDYSNMNSDAIRTQCMMRQIPGYIHMTRDEQIDALKARDIEDAARIAAPVAVGALATSAPEGEKQPNRPKNKPAA